MKPFSVILYTSEYRGDHSADLTIPLVVGANMTIADLITKIPDLGDYIKIQKSKDVRGERPKDE